MSDDDSPLDPLVRHLDAAAEAMRQANHHTYTDREVTDLYPALGALHALFDRFDQLAAHLLRTVTDADAIDFRHDTGDDVAVALSLVEDDLDHVRARTSDVTQVLAAAWARVGHLALDIPDLVCPECGEPAHRGTPTDLSPTQRSAAVLPRYRHADGTQLCPVIGDGIDGSGGYQPATPIPVDTTGPGTSSSDLPQ
jgi:hypothetical protein